MSGGGSGDGPGVDLWILSFSDCMVNLMAFFVMMLTFSSTSNSAKSRVEGVYPTKEGNVAMPMPGAKGGALAPGAPQLQETTEQGSEFATDSDPNPTHNPKASPEAAVGADAFRSRHDIAIPCRRLFYGQGAVLRPDSQECLSLLAGYLGKVPNAVSVSTGTAYGDIDRAAVVIEYLTIRGGLKPERFSVGVSPTREAPDGSPMLIISVLPRSLCP